MLADDDHERHVAAGLERPVALADLYFLEPPALLQPARGRLDRRGVDRLPDGQAGQPEHLRIRRRVIAVHAHLGEHLGRGRTLLDRDLLRGGRAAEREQCDDEHRGEPPHGRFGGRIRIRAPTSAFL